MKFTQTKSKRNMIAGVIILAIIIFACIAGFTVRAYATEDYWNVKIGEDTAVVLASESSAKEVIKSVQNYYVREGAMVKAISCTPEMTVEQETYKLSEKPDLMEVDAAVDYILSGTKERMVYEIKAGDSIWSVAEKHGFTVDEIAEMNPDANLEMIFPGDEINLYQIKPLVNISVTQEVTSEKTIKCKTIKQTSSAVLKNTVVVEKEGADGKKLVTEIETSVNGKVTDTEILSSKVVKKPKDRVIVKGTGILPAPTGGKTYQGNGSAIANYALKFVGNPYVYGGSSLTNGADCSGFVLAVYKHFGITMAHDAGVMRNYGREVSLAEAQPGDLICNPGHVGIYIGGGMMVNAVNEGMGIRVTGVSYTGPVITVRRIVE